MLIVLEKTIWNGNVPNHIYALNKSRDKLYGYVRFGTNEWQWYPEPRSFDAKGRKFIVLEEQPDPIVEVPGEYWDVPSSTGGVWRVTRENGEFSCTCPAAKYRRQECKHIATIRKSLA